MPPTTITSLPTTPMSVLPTPPFTPAVPMPQQAHILESLIFRYQRERMWVKNTQDMILVAVQQTQHGTSSEPPDAAGNGRRLPLWQRRKSRRNLRLSNLTHSKLSNRLLEHDAYSTKVLDMFAALLDARIESCKRVEALVSRSIYTRRSRH